MTGTPLEIERKLLIAEPARDVLDDAAASVSSIVQTYLLNDAGMAERVRRREVRDATGACVQLTHTAKRAVSPGVVEEDEREVSDAEYADLLGRADPDRAAIVKTRWVVPWGGHVVEVDGFTSPAGLWLAEVELGEVDDLVAELDLPPWLTVIAEVTGDPAYANWNLARRAGD